MLSVKEPVKNIKCCNTNVQMSYLRHVAQLCYLIVKHVIGVSCEKREPDRQSERGVISAQCQVRCLSQHHCVLNACLLHTHMSFSWLISWITSFKVSCYRE